MSDAPGATFDGKRLALGGGIAAGVGALCLGVEALFDLHAAFVGYLVGVTYWTSLVLGALILLMTCNAMRAGWPVLVRRFLEAIVAALPALALLMVPLLLDVRRLYIWAGDAPADEHLARLIEHKRPYLNAPFFVGRAVFFFLVWIVVAELLRAWSLRSDRDPSADVAGRRYVFSAAALPAIALTFTFSSFDWLMSLTPAWVSTMFPVCIFGGGFLAAIALLTVLVERADRAGLVRGIRPSHYYALGRLLLAFTIFWAYVNFFQFMLIWIADKPDEVSYFVPRMHGAGGVLSLVLIGVQFVVPFAVLLNYRIKRDGRVLAKVAAWILVAHFADMLWLVTPQIRPSSPIRLGDVGGLLFVSGVVVAVAALRQGGLALVSNNDPALAKALKYESA